MGTAILNAGVGTIKGFEVELWLNPVSGLTFDFSLGVQDPEYDEFDDIVAGSGGYLDRSDEPFPHVSDVNLHLGGEYEFSLDGLIHGRNLGSLTPRWDFLWASKKSYALTRKGFESGAFEQSAVGRHNLRLSWRSPEEVFSATFWVKNVFDKKYINGAVDTVDFLGTGSTRAAAPRMYGFELGYAF